MSLGACNSGFALSEARVGYKDLLVSQDLTNPSADHFQYYTQSHDFELIWMWETAGSKTVMAKLVTSTSSI